MTWPTSDIDTTHADAGTDSPSLWRAAALALSQAFNQVRNHVSAYMQGVLEAANASAARTALGFTTVGSNVATAADVVAARSAIGAADAAATVNLTGAQTVAGKKTFSGGHQSSSNTLPIGYAYGVAAGFTQLTSKTTSVTVNRPCGVLTTHNAALAAGASVVFQVTGLDMECFNGVVIVNPADLVNYDVEASRVSESPPGVAAFSVRLTNRSGGSRSEAVWINYAVIGSSQF